MPLLLHRKDVFLLETEKRIFSKHVLNTQIIQENDFYEQSEYRI